MKIIGVRALRENPGLLNQCAQAKEYLLVTNRNQPLSLSVPFDDELIREGVHINIACKLYEEGILSLVKAARVAKMPVESFLEILGKLGIVVVDQSSEELESDLKHIL